MTEAQILDTKIKILSAARELFAIKGFDGASVRDIARLAEVNIAAVNYHFSSKEKLFHQVMDLIFHESQTAIEEHYVAHPQQKVEDLAVWIFRYFNQKSDILRSVFKMLLSEKGWGEEMDCGPSNGDFGPPGGGVIAHAITAQLKQDVTEANMFWAVKMIFSNVIHLSLMYSNHFCKMNEQDAVYHDIKTLESDIRRLVGVILKDL
jgi:AcrR family transcriptional regulator